jgi:hemerythrin superfamily protein
MQNVPRPDLTEAPGRPEAAPWLPTVSACLEHDHRNIDALLRDVEVFVQEGTLEVADQYFVLFRRRLEAHMDAEETILFPRFEEATRCNGPTTVMRNEHAEMRDLVEVLSIGLSGREARIDPLNVLEEIEHVLASHNAKEERVLYPQIDRAAEAAGDLGDLVARLEAFLRRPGGAHPR